MSCHKAATQAHANTGPVTTVTITPGSTNTLHSLGEISLTNHCETRVDLGAGKDCLLMPKLVGRSDVELTVSLESHSPAGKTLDLTVTQVTTKSGKPLDIALGDYQISLTPKMQ